MPPKKDWNNLKMDREHTTKSHNTQQLIRWKRVLSIITLTLIILCAAISLFYASGVASELLNMSTLFAVYTAIFSVLVPCCICLTLMTLSEPTENTPDTTEIENEKKREEFPLYVDLPHGELIYQDTRIRCRQQILLILNHLTTQEDNFISKEDFAQVLNDDSYKNANESTNAKINTLVSNIRVVLRTLPFEIVNVNRKGYILKKKNNA